LVNGSETTLVVLVFKGKKNLFPIFGHLKAKEMRSYSEEQSENTKNTNCAYLSKKY